MMETIALLLHLQELDAKIRNLRSKIEKREQEIYRRKQELETLQQELVSTRTALEKAKVALAHKELELRDAEEKLKNTRGKLYSGEITSSKELSQWEKSMAKLEETKNALEEAILIDMEKLESLQKEFQEKNQVAKSEQEKSFQAINLFQEEIAGWRTNLENLQAERHRVLAQLDTSIASAYLDLHQKYENPVVLLNDETCSGCHLAVPTTVAKSVRKQEELVRCPNCGRFLYRKVS
jgi:hypothetical protein